MRFSRKSSHFEKKTCGRYSEWDWENLQNLPGNFTKSPISKVVDFINLLVKRGVENDIFEG